MGRAPCCDKANVKKGPWSPEEDAKLKSYIEQHGTGGNWIALPQKIGLKRCGKSCRLRWLNYLRPNIKHGGFSEEEDNIICSLYISIGSRWSIIAAQLPGRTDNDIKNYWNTRLKKKFLGKQRKENARRGTNGLKRGNVNHSMVSSSVPNNNNNNNRTPYWPELPVLAPIPFSNQQHRFSDHASIRKLLIKLGGRFSNDDDQLIHNSTSIPQLFPTDHNLSNTQPLYDQCSNNIPSSASMEGLNYNPVFEHHEFSGDGAVDLQTLQGQNIYVPTGFEEMVSNNGQQKLDGLEFLVGEDMVNSLMSATSELGTINYCLDEMSCLVYDPQVDPNCSDQAMQQRLMLQECGFVNEMDYQGPV